MFEVGISSWQIGIPNVGIPNVGIPKVGLGKLKVGILKLGIGILKLGIGILKVGKPSWITQNNSGLVNFISADCYLRSRVTLI